MAMPATGGTSSCTPQQQAVAVVVFGVSGCGKSTVGRLLAARLGCSVLDADDFHPASNIAKMRQGIALTDSDRLPWLSTLHGVLAEQLRQRCGSGSSEQPPEPGRVARQRLAVLACSALQPGYRRLLATGRQDGAGGGADSCGSGRLEPPPFTTCFVSRSDV